MSDLVNYTVEASSRNVLTVRFDEIASGWEQWVLLTSDRHHDSPDCDRKLERVHLELAKKRNALIFDFGDLFDAMQGKFDPRRSMDDIRPEDVCETYLDSIVMHAAEDYAEYVKNWVLIGYGNHETSIRKHNGTDLISNLVFRMNTEYGGKIQQGFMGGWVRFMFTIVKTKRMSRTLYYHHGGGGGGPVTRGVIQSNRQGLYLPDADIVVNGHTHDSWVLPRARARLSKKGRTYQDLLWFVRLPGYKNDYGDGAEGYHIEKWKDPRPRGAAWLRFYKEGNRILEEITQAVV